LSLLGWSPLCFLVPISNSVEGPSYSIKASIMVKETLRTVSLRLFGSILFVILLLGCSEERHVTTSSAQAREFYAAGIVQWEKFYYVEAVRAFDEAIRLDSNFAMAWARRALLDDATQNHPKASSDIDRAMTLLGRVTQYEQLFIRLQDYRLRYANKQAADLADSMLGLYPEEKEVHLIRGNLHEVTKNYDEAIHSYRQALTIDTSYALAVMSLGYAYSTIGEQERAVEQMEHYIRLAPDAADPRASFADILLRVGRYSEALDQYEKSLVLKPDYWYSMNQIASIYALEGRLEVAEKQFHNGMAAFPESHQSQATHLAIRGNLNILRGRYKEAAEQCREALALDSSNGEAAYGLVNGLRKLKDFGHARDVLIGIRSELEHRNLLRSPFMLRYYLVCSRLELDRGDLENARTLCDSALDFTTALSRGPVFQQIAEIDSRAQRYEDALDACEEALRLNPNHPDALLTLVKVYHASGDTAMTTEIGGRLLEFWKDADPDFLSLRDLRQLLILKRVPSGAYGSSPMIAMQFD
jgi:tetratricopeptide (TPR) repeat protein